MLNIFSWWTAGIQIKSSRGRIDFGIKRSSLMFDKDIDWKHVVFCGFPGWQTIRRLLFCYNSHFSSFQVKWWWVKGALTPFSLMNYFISITVYSYTFNTIELIFFSLICILSLSQWDVGRLDMKKLQEKCEYWIWMQSRISIIIGTAV